MRTQNKDLGSITRGALVGLALLGVSLVGCSKPALPRDNAILEAGKVLIEYQNARPNLVNRSAILHEMYTASKSLPMGMP